MKLRLTKKEQKLLHRNKSDLQIQFYRGSGPGGQNKNKRDTACRITDLVTGIAATAEEHRTQLANRVAAKERLVHKMLEHYRKKDLEERRNKAADREVRVYKEKSGTVKCHYTNQEYRYKDVLDGKELPKIIQNILLTEGQEQC